MNSRPYTRDEILREGDGFPLRGIYCPKCKTHIPIFSELTEEDAKRIHEVGEKDKVQAIRLLRGKAGCGVGWAKIWVMHPNGPQETGFSGGAVCPYCGGRLRSENAKQCPHCLVDWHDPKNVKKLGA